ncbi:MAG: fructose PTS transporter subunit IIA [candidate division WOR-3 bacterium]|nr:fructose PTS transporter subunit IIA [candidate division WOR-3 bacterium]
MAKISELLPRSAIILNLQSKEKFDVIGELVRPLLATGAITDEPEFVSAIVRRENMESTGIGLGVAIPHARTKAVANIVLAFGRSDAGVDFSSLDGKPSHLIFLIAAPEEQKTEYIMTLARLSKLLRKDEVRIGLNKAGSPDDIARVILQHES